MHKTLALFMPPTPFLFVIGLCVFVSFQRAHAEPLPQAGPEFPGSELNSDYLLSRLSLDYSDTDTLPDYESWTGDSTESRPSQKPTVALFKSMLVPGLGQIGNRQYIKAALVIGAEGLLFSRWLKFRRETSDARAAFEAQPFGDSRRALLFGEFEAVKNDRNYYAWLTGTSIFLSMFDAFVDAHLRNFPGPGSELTIGPIRGPQPGSTEQTAIGVTLSFRF